MLFGKNPGGLHFTFELAGKRVVYCYIRKNASSAFKKLIVDCSPFSNLMKENENPIHFLYKYHKSTAKDFSRADHIIFVYRDPIERILSLFKNKFIQQIGAQDILDLRQRKQLKVSSCFFAKKHCDATTL